LFFYCSKKLNFKEAVTFNSLKGEIVIPSVGALALLVVLIIVYTAISVTNFSDDLTEQRLVTASQTTRSYLESLQERNRITSQAVSQHQVVLENLRNWNSGINQDESRRLLIDHLNSIKSD